MIWLNSSDCRTCSSNSFKGDDCTARSKGKSDSFLVQSVLKDHAATGRKDMGDNWNNTMKTGADMMRPMTDWWNSLQAQFKASDDAQTHAADDASGALGGLRSSVDPAASSLGKIPSAADAAVNALHAMAAQIASFKMPTVGGTVSSSGYSKRLDDEMGDRLRRAYA
jgi:hypothetical protein